MMSISFKSVSRLLTVLLLAAGCLWICGMADALAQATNFEAVQKSIGKSAVKVPKFISVMAYVIGAAFAADGLLKLKDWMGDSERNTLNAAMFRLIVAALLIYLPYGMQLANSTLFGEEAGTGVIPSTPPPKLGIFQKP